MSDTTTTFTTIRDERIDKDWPDSTSETHVLINGELADKLRAFHDRKGAVLIITMGEEGGYSEFTVEWDYEASLTIGGHVVMPPTWAQGHTPIEEQYASGGVVGGGWRVDALAKHLLEVGGAS